MNKFKKIIGIMLVTIFIFIGSIGAQASDYGSYFDSMLQFVEGMYYKDLTDEEGLKAALKGLLQSLDKYSDFYDKEELQAFNNNISGNYVGIGAGLEKNGSYIKIIKVYDGSPAEKAGILEGDLITGVNGVSTEGKTVETVASSIRGEADTKVNITVLRQNKTLKFTLVRGTVNLAPVQYRIEDDKTAYIRIDTFGSGTADNFSKAMAEVDKNNITKIILDLRGNTGGFVDEAVKVAEKLVPQGTITTLDYKTNEMSDRVYVSNSNHPDYIVAVLVDENTASASEIVAGALEDYGNGYLLGQKTYGKGVFQNLFTVLTPEAHKKYSEIYDSDYVSEIQWISYNGVYPNEDEILGAAKITTGHYLTPKGRAIDGIGLKPAVTIPNPTYPNNVDLSNVKKLSNKETLSLNNYGEEVYNAERVLRAGGYLTSTPDKQFDAETKEAVKKYQAAAKLPMTGTIDLKTRDWLNRTLVNLRNTCDKQYAKAVETLSWFRD